MRSVLRILLISAITGLSSAAGDNAAVQAEINAANALMAQGKAAEARAAFELILAHAPENPEANATVALGACDAGNWEKALQCSEKALAADPNNARYQYVWGAANGIAAMKSGVLSKLGHAKKCLAAYRRASELEPANQQYHWALLNYYQQAPGFAGGDVELAYVEAGVIRRLDAEVGRRAFVQIYVSQKKYDLAFREYDEALRANADDQAALYGLGRVALTSKQRLTDGLAAFRRCLELPSPPGSTARVRTDLHWRIGTVLEARHQREAARAEYISALKDSPDYAPAKRALEALGEAKG